MAPVLLPKVEALIHRYGMLTHGDGVVVACSGGPDSVTLLGLLVELQERYHLQLTAVYVDHQLRPEAAEEGEFVRRVAQQWQVPTVVRRIKKDLHQGPDSVQVQARDERYRLLAEVAKQVGACRIATGHTADDQAETLVMRFLRGTGSQGLAGILPVMGSIIRPLLLVRRSETEAYCAARGIVPVHDPSNAEDVYLRNHIRHHLMPELGFYNPRLIEALGNLAETSRAENEWMDVAVTALLAEMAIATDGGWWCASKAFLAQHLALQRRALRILARRLGVEQELDFDHVDDLMGIIYNDQTGTSIDLPDGLTLWVERGGFWLGPRKESPVFDIALLPSGSIDLPNGDLRLITDVQAGGMESLGELQYESSVGRQPWEPHGDTVCLDWQQVQGSLRVRNRHTGDRFRPLGMRGDKKLHDMFVDEGVPRRWRDRLPVVTDSQGILWVPGTRPADRAKITSSTRQILRVQVLHRTDV